MPSLEAVATFRVRSYLITAELHAARAVARIVGHDPAFASTVTASTISGAAVNSQPPNSKTT
jgi:hypothetical protein